MDKIIQKKIKEILFYHKVILYFFLGLLWALSQATYSFPFLTWFGLVPFLFTIKYEDTRYGLFYTIIFGSTVYLFNLWWMIPAVAKVLMITFPAPVLVFPAWIVSFLIYLFMSIFHGFVYVIIFYLARFLSKRSLYVFYIVFPFIATVLDYFFPKVWKDQIGYSQYVFFHFTQIADLFGVPAITLIVLCCNSSIIILIEAIIEYKYIKRSITLFLTIIAVIFISSFYGMHRYNEIMMIADKTQKVKIGIVQGNFTGEDKFNSNKYPDMINTYNDLSKAIIIQNPDLIVWPESAVPYERNVESENYDVIKYFYKTPLLTGIILSKTENNITKYYNSMVFISSDNKRLDYYNKIKIIPFAEKPIIPFFNNLKFVGLKNFDSGNENKIFEYKNIKIAPDICYEIIFPELISKSLNIKGKEANLIVNITNDSWFGKNVLPKLHMHLVGFRAIENRKSIIRVASTGHSVYYNPGGDLIYISDLFKKTSSVIEVPLLEIKTVYRVWGKYVIWMFLYILIVILIIAFIRISIFRYYKRILIEKKIHSYNLKKMWLE